MYKNAEKVLNDRDNISKSQVRSAVAKARIELNVRKINTMIHLIQPPSHDEVILPKNKGANDGDDGSPLDSDEIQKLRSEEQKMKIRLMKSAAQGPVDARVRPLDTRRSDRWVGEMNSAVEPYGDNKPRDSVQKRKKKEQLSQAAIHAVEKKLQMAIRGMSVWWIFCARCVCCAVLCGVYTVRIVRMCCVFAYPYTNSAYRSALGVVFCAVCTVPPCCVLSTALSAVRAVSAKPAPPLSAMLACT
jgi:hypothetical protein